MQSKAEIKARRYADIARGYGMSAEVRLDHSDPTLYSDGRVMLPASTTAWVEIRETDVGVFGEHLTAGWRSVDPGQSGHNASTRFVAAWKSAAFIKTRKFTSEKRFASWLSIYDYKTR